MREVSPEYTAVVKQLKKHVSDLMIIIKRAAHFLKPIKVYHGIESDSNNGAASSAAHWNVVLVLISLVTVIMRFWN